MTKKSIFGMNPNTILSCFFTSRRRR